MIIVIAAVRRKAGMTRSEFFDYIVGTHGGIARANPLTLRRYVQNHVYDGCHGVATDTSYLVPTPIDSVTELFFDTVEDMVTCFSHEYTRTVTAADGKNFADMSTSISLVGRMVREQGAVPDGAVKLLWFLKAAKGVDRTAFLEGWSAADSAAEMIQGIAARRSVEAMPPNPSGAGGSSHFGGAEVVAFDGVQELWISASDVNGVARAFEAVFAAPSEWIDRSESFWVLANEKQIIPEG